MQNYQQFHADSIEANEESRFSNQSHSFSPEQPNYLTLQEMTKQDTIKTIFKIYLEQGSQWKFIKSQIGHKHIRYPKNYVYSSMKKATKILESFDTQVIQQQRKMSRKDTLISLVEVVNHIQKEMATENRKLSCQSTLFKLKKNILLLSFWEECFCSQEIAELLKSIKSMNFKLKSLGIFKAKNKKNWKISQKGWELIRSLDSEAHIFGKGRNQTNELSKLLILDCQPEGINACQVQLCQARDLVQQANMILGIEEEAEGSYIFF